jgi:hypothetical protein
VLNAFYTDPRRTLIGVAIILAGVPVYVWLRRKSA